MISIAVCLLTIFSMFCAFAAYNDGGYLIPRGFALTWLSGLLAGMILVLLLIAAGGIGQGP